jgi:hypothetical protein
LVSDEEGQWFLPIMRYRVSTDPVSRFQRQGGGVFPVAAGERRSTEVMKTPRLGTTHYTPEQETLTWLNFSRGRLAQFNAV